MEWVGGWIFSSVFGCLCRCAVEEIGLISVASYDVCCEARTVVRLVVSQRSKTGWDCQETGAGSAGSLAVRLRGGYLGMAVVGLGGGATG